jgi:hypothetical protein
MTLGWMSGFRRFERLWCSLLQGQTILFFLTAWYWTWGHHDNFETSDTFRTAIRRHIPEDLVRQQHHCEDHIMSLMWSLYAELNTDLVVWNYWLHAFLTTALDVRVWSRRKWNLGLFLGRGCDCLFSTPCHRLRDLNPPSVPGCRGFFNREQSRGDVYLYVELGW